MARAGALADAVIRELRANGEGMAL